MSGFVQGGIAKPADHGGAYIVSPANRVSEKTPGNLAIKRLTYPCSANGRKRGPQLALFSSQTA